MCLIIFSWQPESQRPLILAANRDELHSRASLDAHDWTDPPGIFGGRDLEKKGSWLALSKPEGKNNYRLACLTNFRKPDQNAYPLSRGEIVRNFLISSESAFNYAQQIPFQHHAGFNALFMDGKDLVYCHHSSDNKPFIERLKSGVYGLSNAKLDTPWPKLVKSKQAFTNLNPYDSSETIANHLLSCLTDKEIAEDDTLLKQVSAF